MKTPQQGWDEAQKEYWRKHHKVMGCYGCKWAEKSSLGCRGCCTYYGSIEVKEDGRCEACRPERCA